MKIKSNYEGFDFINIWDINLSINDGYPYLRDNPPITFNN